MGTEWREPAVDDVVTSRSSFLGSQVPRPTLRDPVSTRGFISQGYGLHLLEFSIGIHFQDSLFSFHFHKEVL